MVAANGRSRLDGFRQQLVPDPAATEARQLEAVQPEVEHLLDVRGIQHGHQEVFEQQLGMIGVDRRAHCGIIARQDENAAVFRRAVVVALAHGVEALVESGSLAVPHRRHAVVIGVVVVVNLLRPPDRGRGHVLIGCGPEPNVVLLYLICGTPQLDIHYGHRRSAVAGNEPGRIETRGQVPTPLNHQHSENCLRAGQVDAAFVERIFIVQRNWRCGHKVSMTPAPDRDLSIGARI
jgi:hypothetical protein